MLRFMLFPGILFYIIKTASQFLLSKFYYNGRRNVGCKIIHVDVINLTIFMYFLNSKTDYVKNEHTKEDGAVKSNV